jgi:hypothetical protein
MDVRINIERKLVSALKSETEFKPFLDTALSIFEALSIKIGNLTSLHFS